MKQQTTTCLIQEAAWRSTPPEIPGKDPISITPHIREIVTGKRRARNRWQRNRNRIDKRVYNQLTRQLKAALQDTRNATFETHQHLIKRRPYSLESHQTVQKTNNSRSSNPTGRWQLGKNRHRKSYSLR